MKDKKETYWGPKVGSDVDVKYVKVISGEVDDRLPSFAQEDECNSCENCKCKSTKY